MDLLEKQELFTRTGSYRKLEDVVSHRIVGLYFSAGWCPPCCQFTPILASLYNELQQRNAPFEIIFISGDRTEDGMLEYMKNMHADWYALAFKEEDLRLELMLKYNVFGFPRLVILKPNGDLITDTGRKEVTDRGVVCFRNWCSSAGISEILPPEFRRKKDSEDDTEDKENENSGECDEIN